MRCKRDERAGRAVPAGKLARPCLWKIGAPTKVKPAGLKVLRGLSKNMGQMRGDVHGAD